TGATGSGFFLVVSQARAPTVRTQASGSKRTTTISFALPHVSVADEVRGMAAAPYRWNSRDRWNSRAAPPSALRCELPGATHLWRSRAAEAVLFKSPAATGKWPRGFLINQTKGNDSLAL